MDGTACWWRTAQCPLGLLQQTSRQRVEEVGGLHLWSFWTPWRSALTRRADPRMTVVAPLLCALGARRYTLAPLWMSVGRRPLAGGRCLGHPSRVRKRWTVGTEGHRGGSTTATAGRVSRGAPVGPASAPCHRLSEDRLPPRATCRTAASHPCGGSGGPPPPPPVPPQPSPPPPSLTAALAGGQRRRSRRVCRRQGGGPSVAVGGWWRRSVLGWVVRGRRIWVGRRKCLGDGGEAAAGREGRGGVGKQYLWGGRR